MEPDHLKIMSELKKIRTLLALLVYDKNSVGVGVFKSDDEVFGPVDRELRK
jgi:hypothetical protein